MDSLSDNATSHGKPNPRDPNRGNLGEVVAALARAYEQLDAAALVRFYSEDSEWLDTRGQRARGQTQIEAHVSELFGRGWAPGDTLSAQAMINVKVLDASLALAWISTDRASVEAARAAVTQGAQRRLHRMQVLRYSEGQWLVVTELVMDDTSIVRGGRAMDARCN